MRVLQLLGLGRERWTHCLHRHRHSVTPLLERIQQWRRSTWRPKLPKLLPALVEGYGELFGGGGRYKALAKGSTDLRNPLCWRDMRAAKPSDDSTALLCLPAFTLLGFSKCGTSRKCRGGGGREKLQHCAPKLW